MARDPQKKKRRRFQLRGKTRWRLAIAALLCGPLTGLSLMLIIGGLTLLFQSSGPAIPPEVLLGGAILGAAVGWPFMAVYGLPVHAVLYRRGSHKLGSYVLFGVLGGFLASVIAGVAAFFFRTGPLNAYQYGVGAAFGIFILVATVIASVFFWLMRRPDRDTDTTEALASTFD